MQLCENFSWGYFWRQSIIFKYTFFLWSWENVISGDVSLKIVVQGHGEGAQVCS